MAIYRRERSTRLIVIGLVLASLITITLDFRGGERGPLATAGRVALSVMGPLQEGVATVIRPVAAFFSAIAEIGSLRAENERLQTELDEVAGAQARSQEVEAELRELRELLGLRDELGFRTIGARVVGESPSNFELAVTVNAGAVDEVEIDMPVIGPRGLVGRIVEVGRSESKVLLLLDASSGVAVRIATSRETGVLVGQRERDLRLDLVDPDTVVEGGEQVVTSGLGGIYPSGIPVGVVSRVIPDEVGPQKQILVRPTVDFSRLSEVLIVLPPASNESQT
jgi:rod shape-determining protein MreC